MVAVGNLCKCYLHCTVILPDSIPAHTLGLFVLHDTVYAFMFLLFFLFAFLQNRSKHENSRQEAVLLSRMKHPHIVAFQEAFEGIDTHKHTTSHPPFKTRYFELIRT